MTNSKTSAFATVFMFHAVGELQNDDLADRAYAISSDSFFNLLSRLGVTHSIAQCRQKQTLSRPVFTFDDGHLSNYEFAMLMSEKNCSADFFVNPDLVGKKHYMSWTQLAELSRAGHSIQSHGLDHRFLSECSNHELARQLTCSKEKIEQSLALPVTLLAPPGGRFDRRCVELAKTTGYEAMAISAPGYWHDLTQFLIPRIPVMRGIQCEQLVDACNIPSKLVSRLTMKYRFTRAAKILFGDSRYDALRNYFMNKKA